MEPDVIALVLEQQQYDPARGRQHEVRQTCLYLQRNAEGRFEERRVASVRVYIAAVVKIIVVSGVSFYVCVSARA